MRQPYLALTALGSLALLLLLSAGGRTAHAAPAVPAPVTLAIEVAGEACDGGRSLGDRVLGRSHLIELRAKADHRAWIVVREKDGFEAKVTLDKSVRTLHGARCHDVLEAAALVIAIKLDPNARTEPTPEPEPEPAPNAVPVAAPAAASTPHSTTAPLELARPSRDAPAASAPTNEGDRRVVLSAGPSAIAFILPDLAVGAHAGVGWMGKRASVHAGAAILTTEPVESGGSLATYRLTEGFVTGCPWRVELSTTVSFRPCVELHAGAIWASGHGAPAPGDQSTFWLSAAASPRLAWRWGRHSIEIAPSLLVPITTPQFVFEKPRITVHRVPALGTALALTYSLAVL